MSFQPNLNYIGLQKAFSAHARSATENRERLRSFVENFSKRLAQNLGLEDAPVLGRLGRLNYIQFLFIDNETGKVGAPVGLQEIEIAGEDEPSMHFAIGLAIGPEGEAPEVYYWAHYFARLAQEKLTLREQRAEGKVHSPPNLHVAIERFIHAAADAVSVGAIAHSANVANFGTGFVKIDL